MEKRVWILYVTFFRDIHWLKFSMDSFVKYAKGFAGVTIVVPTTDLHHFLAFERMYSKPECPVLVKNFLEYPGRGFLHHLAMKCYADVFCPGATHVLHIDPDCLWVEPVTPEGYFVDGKPVLVVESFELLARYFKERAYWKVGVDETLGIDAKYETMCRHPAVHHLDLYPAVRKRVEKVHQTPFLDFYLKGKNSFPQTRSEFPVLGAYALEYMRDRYHIWDCTKARDEGLAKILADREIPLGHPRPHLKQLWSHGGADKYMAEINRILAA